MYSIVYKSIANPNLTSEDISNILKTSRAFNKMNNITGCLIYYNHKFIQILEGDKLLLEELFSTIKKDRRHSGIQILSENYTGKRIFHTWNMAYVDLSSETEPKTFKENLITYSELTAKSNEESKAFWDAVKAILK